MKSAEEWARGLEFVVDGLSATTISAIQADATADIQSQVEQLRGEVGEAESSLNFTREWYSERLKRLSQFIREEIPEPQKTRYFSIIANGTADVSEPPTYSQLMETVKWERDSLLTALEKCVVALEIARRQLVLWGMSGMGTDPVDLSKLDDALATAKPLLNKQ